MSNTTRIIMIWGGAIFLYLILAHAGPTKQVLAGLDNFVSGTTKTLQARN